MTIVDQFKALSLPEMSNTLGELQTLHKAAVERRKAELQAELTALTGKVRAKYVSGTHSWSGRGTAPAFIVEHEKKGGRREDFAVT
jgi:hypothetical protein